MVMARRNRVEVGVTVEVPPEVERQARKRAAEAGEPENLEPYLLDQLLFDYEFDFQRGRDTESEFLRSSA